MKKIFAMLLASMMVLGLGTGVLAANDPNADKTDGNYVDEPTVTVTKNYKLTNEGEGKDSPAETFSFENVKCISVEEAGIDKDGNVVTPDTAPELNLSDVTVTYAKGDAGNTDNMTKNFTIPLPTYEAVGIYTYTFNEKDNGTAGVSYDTTAVRLVVTVVEQNGKIRVAAVHCEDWSDNTSPSYKENSTKTDNFDNTYSAGSLEVSKKVTGNMGDQSKYFKVTVKFTAPTGDKVNSDIYVTLGSEHTHSDDCYTINCQDTTENHVHGDDCKKLICENELDEDITVDETEKKMIMYADTNDKEDGVQGWDTKEVDIWLKHGDTVKFDNIPYGVTYVVEEADYTGEPDKYDPAFYQYKVMIGTTTIWTDEGDTINGEVYDAKKIAELCVIDSASEAVAITNNKGTEVDTGISVDSIPYIAILGAVALGGTGFVVSKKRRSED